MKYASAAAFRAALEQRLKHDADGDGARLMRLRKRVAFDRLLVRLEAVASGRWLLKGAYALDLRMGDRSRTTMDVDIEWQADADGRMRPCWMRRSMMQVTPSSSRSSERRARRTNSAVARVSTFSRVWRGACSSGSSWTWASSGRRTSLWGVWRYRTIWRSRCRVRRDRRHSRRAPDRGEAACVHANVRREPEEQPHQGPGRSGADR